MKYKIKRSTTSHSRPFHYLGVCVCVSVSLPPLRIVLGGCQCLYLFMLPLLTKGRIIPRLLNASWKICSLVVNGQSFLGYRRLSVKSLLHVGSLFLFVCRQKRFTNRLYALMIDAPFPSAAAGERRERDGHEGRELMKSSSRSPSLYREGPTGRLHSNCR